MKVGDKCEFGELIHAEGDVAVIIDIEGKICVKSLRGLKKKIDPIDILLQKFEGKKPNKNYIKFLTDLESQGLIKFTVGESK